MSEETQNKTLTKAPVKLRGLYAFKEGMATVFSELGEAVPVTVLRFEPWVVSQVKRTESDGYEGVQLACRPKSAKNSSAASAGHMKKAAWESGASLIREIRQQVDGVEVGMPVDIHTLAKADKVKITARSKGRGFAGSVKRFNFGGGPASHGSKFHRQPGSSGNRTWPGRVMPGKKFPGHLGDETVSVKSAEIVDVLPEEGVILVRGPVPGARQSLVRLLKLEN